MNHRTEFILSLAVLTSAVVMLVSCEQNSAPGATGKASSAAIPPGEGDVPSIFTPTIPEGEPALEAPAVVTAPPFVPPPIMRSERAKVVVNLEVIEVEKPIAEGVNYVFWTFGGTVPGSFIRVRVGDLVELHLKNHPSSKMPHNIDLHAVTGQGGGAGASFTAPGHESVFSFTPINPGLFVYHCATAPVAMHVANGMYGLILVEPEKGLPPVDREYYVMQGDFYTRGPNGEAGLQPFSMEKALAEKPDYVLFNGSLGALAGDKALTAKPGERIRLYVGNGGPNLTSSFHVIGEIFDSVRVEGGSTVNHNVQTTLIPAGGAAIVEFKVEVPATYIMVDHSLTRAFNKGALGLIQVAGPENKLVYSGRISDLVYRPEGATVQTIPQAGATLAPAKSKQERMERGKAIYASICFACHQPEGQGIPLAFPPVAKSDYLNADHNRAISVVSRGLTGKITVNGLNFEGIMPGLGLPDEGVANVLTYVLNSFGNNGGEITPDMVKQVRESPPN